MMRRFPSSEVDRSRAGKLVHSAESYGREVHLITYIEGVAGTDPRYAVMERLICRTAGQAREMARVLREAEFKE